MTKTAVAVIDDNAILAAAASAGKPAPTRGRQDGGDDSAVATEFQDNLPDVHLDGTQLQQVLSNLVKNAIDDMRSVAPETRRLRLTMGFDGHSTVLLSVQDSGPGIPVEDRERIFDPFFTTKSGGMGLGLAICSTVVENHEGKLRLIKSDSEGSI
jgi:signal transduction histidine kinase